MDTKEYKTKKLYLLIVLFFIAQSAINLGNYTSLVYSAVAFTELSKPAFLVLFQTFGSLLAFLLLNTTRVPIVRRISLPILTFLNLVAAILCSNVGVFGAWVCFVMVRVVLSNVLISKLQAYLPLVTGSQEETQYYSKFMQSLALFSFLVALTLSPWAQQILGPSKVYLIDAMSMLGILLVMVLTDFRGNVCGIDGGGTAAGVSKLSIRNTLIFAPHLIWMWLVAGSFHVIEVPYLTNLVKLSPSQLTLVFLIAGIGAVAGSLFIPTKFISTHKHGTVSYAALAISALSLIYLKSTSLPCILAIVLMYGVSNGCFNVGLSNIIYENIRVDKQASAFALYRLLTNIAVVAAAGVMSLFKDIRHAFDGQVVLTAMGMGLYFALTALRNRMQGSVE